MNIGLLEINRETVAKELARILADEFVIYIKTRNAHWNVTGSDFAEKHKLFETQYEQLDDIIDNVAERIRALGHFVPAGLSATLAGTNLKDEVFPSYSSSAIIPNLLADHEPSFEISGTKYHFLQMNNKILEQVISLLV
jgi:starvation-inducible DNA-binding protein